MRSRSLASLFAVCCGVGVGACRGEDAPEPSRSSGASASSASATPTAPTLTQDQLEAVKRLSSNVHPEHWTFPALDVARKGSARVLEYIALTASEPSLAAASLHALQQTAHRRGLGSVAADPATLAVLEKHLASEDPVVAFRALRLTRLVLRASGAPPELVRRVVGLGARYPNGAGRHALLLALSEASRDLQGAPATALAVGALADAEAFVVSQALANLVHSLDALEDREGVRRRAAELLHHVDPGVRGRALTLASLLEPPSAAFPQAWLDALADESPHVRAQGAMALGRLGNPSAIHHLVRLARDEEPSIYTLRGFRTLDGAPGKMKHRVAGTSTVAGAALAAIFEIVKGVPSLSPLPGRDTGSAADRAQALETWYQRNRRALGKVEGKLPPKVAEPSRPSGATRQDAHAH